MARASPNLTLKATGKINKGSINRLRKVIDLQRELYNHSLHWLEFRPETDFNTLRDTLRKELTQLRTEDRSYWNILRDISDGTLQRAITNHLRHTAPKEGSEPAGKPRRKTAERFRTLTLLSPQNDVIFPNTRGTKLKLEAKGLPNIRLKSSQYLPTDQQPNTVHITLKRGVIHLRLVYDQPAHPTLKPKHLVLNAIGKAISVATSMGINYHSPNESELDQHIKGTQQSLQKKIAAGIRTGLCGYKAVLDDQNKQLLTARDKPRRELVWLQTPSKSYAKTRQLLSELYYKRNKLRKDFKHRITSAIVQMALDQGIDLIAVEDLNIPNMTASARGTEKNTAETSGPSPASTAPYSSRAGAKSWRCSGTRPARQVSASYQSGPDGPPRPATSVRPWTPCPEEARPTSPAPPAATTRTPTPTPARSSPREDSEN